MDLSRMSDIVGVRVIMDSIENQNRALDLLTNELVTKTVYDYRTAERLYRCIHVIVRTDQQLLEIQLRTLPQHLWAVESEAFGEQVKEGRRSDRIQSYLTTLSKASQHLDQGETLTDNQFADIPFVTERTPLAGLFQNLKRDFYRATNHYTPHHSGNTFIVVFDNELGQLLHEYSFPPTERSQAIDYYRRMTHSLSDERFETLIFNSVSTEVLAVTHPRFFTR